MFRLRDPNNYYIVRANALENNYRLYHVVNGRRSQFAGSNFKVTSGEWHELRVEVTGNKITCYYDGDKKIEATDSTFKDAGKVGLWTKADSVTYFDDLKGDREIVAVADYTRKSTIMNRKRRLILKLVLTPPVSGGEISHDQKSCVAHPSSSLNAQIGTVCFKERVFVACSCDHGLAHILC